MRHRADQFKADAWPGYRSEPHHRAHAADESEPTINPAFSAWRPDLDVFTSADKLRRPEPGGVLFVGSSTIRLWRELEQHFRQQPVIINRGFGGSTLAACNFFAKQLVVQYRPAQGVKFILAGYGHFKTSALNQRR